MTSLLKIKLPCVTHVRFFLAFLGLVLTSFLFTSYELGVTPPCRSEGGCTELLAGPSSLLFGAPISALGLIAYFGIAFACISGLRKKIWVAGVVVSFVSVLASIGFVGYATLYLATVCSYCIGSTALFSCIAATYALELTGTTHVEAKDRGITRTVFGTLTSFSILCGVGLVIAVTWLTPKPVLPTPSVLISESAPKFGSTNPEITIVMFIDLQCGPCHDALQSAEEIAASRKDVQIVVRHNPLPIHGLADDLAELLQAASRSHSTQDVLRKIVQMDPRSLDEVDELAKDLGVSVVSSDREHVLADKRLAATLKIFWAPAVFVVRADKVQYVSDFNAKTFALFVDSHSKSQ